MVKLRPSVLVKFPCVTFGKRTSIVFNSVATKKYDLREFEAVRFNVSEDKKMVKFEFFPEIDKMLVSLGFVKLSTISRNNATARGGTRLAEEMYPIVKPYETENWHVVIKCFVFETERHTGELPELHCDITKYEEVRRTRR